MLRLEEQRTGRGQKLGALASAAKRQKPLRASAASGLSSLPKHIDTPPNRWHPPVHPDMKKLTQHTRKTGATPPTTAPATNHIVVHEISTWPQFVALASDGRFAKWAFRGQADETWPLWSKLTRELMNREVHPNHWEGQEKYILRFFQRHSFHFVAKMAEIDDTPRWLALMQHHGAPTRLLDFSWSPYVAAFFALEATKKDSAVWAVNSGDLKSFAFGPYRGEDLRPVPLNEVLESVDARGPDAVVFGEPYFKNQRLIAQSGTIAWPQDITRPLEQILSRRPNMVAKIIFRGKEVRHHGLQELLRMNITNATLFPDLDGLAKSLNCLLELHWAYDPTKPTKPSYPKAPIGSADTSAPARLAWPAKQRVGGGGRGR